MPKPRMRSGVMKRKRKRLAKGVKEVYVKAKKGKQHRCAICKAPLAGVGKGKTKSERKPSRKFGGTLCPSCTERVLRYAARVSAGEISLDDVELRYVEYVKPLTAGK